jgi:2-dehydro-3-deoxyphosphogluconate aldolase/(4S)-4-hydroxy-2-oxoglutarate aldolase
MKSTASRADIVTRIEATGVVAVIRLTDAGVGRDVAQALVAGGVVALEVTMTVPNAVALIEQLVKALPESCIVGAGTVVDGPTAEAVMDAGARFVVGPVLRPDVIAACRARDVAVMPGCFSPTEILTAWEAGADIVKVFPATSLGPAFFKDMRGPLPHVKLMPTGGVTKQNAGEWIKAGAVAIGVGTALVDAAAVKERRFDAITASAREFIAAVGTARQGART